MLKKSLIFLTIALVSVGAALGTQTYTLKAPEIIIERTLDGYDRVLFKQGARDYVSPGYPDLPCRVYRYAVPPDIVPGSLQVEYSVGSMRSLGTYRIREVPAWATAAEKGSLVLPKADVYGKNAYFPEKPVEDVGSAQMRKWKFVGIRFNPLQYNPVTRELRIISEVEIRLRYRRRGMSASIRRGLNDTVMDDRAKETLVNFQEARIWYRPLSAARPAALYNYVIVTSDRIKNASRELGRFIDYLSYRGFSPLVITESHYGGMAGQNPNGTAEKIRQWLKTYYVEYGIKYVLLIGNPDPADPRPSDDFVGDVPMKMFFPRLGEPQYIESPTDLFYADLTGNWDLNGDGYFGSVLDQGGMDFAPEVYVGRIPVYNDVNAIADLDKILKKTIRYGVSSDITWRKSCLLPESFLAAGIDDAYWAQNMISGFLGPGSYSTTRMYMKGSVCSACNSIWPTDIELISDNTKDYWATYPKSCGMVWWSGHGNSSGAYLGYENCGGSGVLFTGDQAQYLNDAYPSMTFQNSCTNGYPEVSYNLGTALLRNGAVATVSASRVSWFIVENYYIGHKYDHQSRSIGFCYGENLVGHFGQNGYGAGQALFESKDFQPFENRGIDGRVLWMNAYDFNLYGDPSLNLGLQGLGDLDLTSPQEGESFYAETTQTIKWTTDGQASDLVTIEYSKDGGQTWASCVDSTANTGTYDWTIPHGVNSEHCLVRVRYAGQSFPYDICDGEFTVITDDPPSVAITAPANGESVYGTLTIGADATDDFGVVKVEFYLDGNKGGEATAAPYGLSWDTTQVANGSHAIKAVAYDTRDQASEPHKISVNVQNIVVSLTAVRKTESAWLVKRDYGKIDMSIDNPGNATAAKYILYRRADAGSWQTLKEFAPADVTNDALSYFDKYLETGVSYAYVVEVVDASGVKIGYSEEKTL